MDKRPNILFVFPDQLGARWLPMYDNPVVKAPNLERFAETSTVFTHAITTSPVCTPYRGCLLTGRYPSQTGVLENGQALPDDAVTFAHLLNEAGYDTHYVGKWHLSGDPQQNRWVPPEKRGGFQHFVGWESHHVDHNAGLIWEDDPDEVIQMMGHETDGLTDLAIRQLYTAVQSDNPFCMVVSYQAPHPPCSPPDEYLDLYDDVDLFQEPTADRSAYYDRPEWNADYDVETFRKRYFGEITQIDHAFGQLLDTLENLDLTDNTLVIFTSDHGEMAGARGLFGKGVMYAEALHIPLIVRYPGQRQYRSSDVVASTVDFLPTLLDYVGCEPYEYAQGCSLRAVIEGTVTVSIPATFSEYHNYCVVVDHFKLFTDGRTPKPLALYDTYADHYEENNLIDDPQYADIKQHLLEQLSTWHIQVNGETVK